jgi:hypothetical protein
MRDHIRREAAAQAISAAWFVVPLSAAAAALMALAMLDLPPLDPPVPAAMPLAAPVIVPTAADPGSEPLPIQYDHIQAF